MAERLEPSVIRSKNRERGWTLADLAKAAEISIPTAHRVAKGIGVSTVTLSKVSRAYANHKAKPALIELLSQEAS